MGVVHKNIQFVRDELRRMIHSFIDFKNLAPLTRENLREHTAASVRSQAPLSSVGTSASRPRARRVMLTRGH